MIAIDELKEVFIAKLADTHSLDAALLKAAWIAYQEGLADGRAECHASADQPRIQPS